MFLLGHSRCITLLTVPPAGLRNSPRQALAAQLSAKVLYERAGYDAYGDVFLDAGIEHVMMAKALA